MSGIIRPMFSRRRSHPSARLTPMAASRLNSRQLLPFGDNTGAGFIVISGIMKLLRPLLALLLLPATALHAQETSPPPTSPLETKFREGLYAEEAKQDLTAAAKAYQEIVAGFDRDRETASSALFRLGEVYRKQNRPKEAAAAFRRVALEFPDRDPLARLARENLTALGEPLPTVPGAAAPPGPDAEEDKALARLHQLEKDSPDVILKPDNSLKKNGCISCDEAASAGYLRVMQWFLEHGASVDVTPSGASPLSLAAAYGRTPMVTFLLEKGAAIAGTLEAAPGGPTDDETTWRVDSPLRMAALNGHLEIVKLLVDKGADVNGRKKERKGEKGEPVIFYTHAPLTAAADAGHRAIVDYLLAHGADANADRGQPLLLAVENGYPEVAAALLVGGADVNKPKRGLPGEALTTGFPQLARRRPLPAGGTPGAVRDGIGRLDNNSTPVSYQGYATWHGTGAKHDFFTPLQMAALHAAPELVSLLLQHGAEVDAKSDAGSTALELALVMNRPDIVKLLVKAGANANHPAPGGMRLIYLPISRLDRPMYDLLRAARAEVSGQSPDGVSALHVLLQYHGLVNEPDKYLPWVQLLLKDGADPNGDEMFRPVNAAAEAGSLPMIQMLQEKGADFTPDNADAPLPLALEDGFNLNSIPVLKALIAAGADPAARSTMPKESNEPSWRNRTKVTPLNMLQAAASWVPDLNLLEEVIALQPAPAQSWASVKNIYLNAKKKLAEQAATPAGQGTSISSSDDPFHTTKEARERVVQTAPAVIQRLWDYESRERNEQRSQRVWFRMLTNKQGDYQTEETKQNEQGGHSYKTTYSYTAFVPASPGPQPVNIVEAIAFAYGPAAHEKPDRWMQPATMPDFTALTILRHDPATGRIVQRESVNLAAFVEKGDVSALPALQPGDVIEAIGIEKSLFDWRDFPEPYLAFFRKALPPRKVTLKAGDWQREFQLDQWVYGFRWDPSTSKLAIEPLLSQIIRYLPKPGWFYRLNAARYTPGNGTVQTLDLSIPLPPDKDITLRDGDRIELEAVPADDPALTTRLKQGLFVSREADGFLREVFHDPATPPLKWDEDLMTQVLLQFCTNSESVLPFSSLQEKTGRHPSPDNGWGGCLELPRQKDAAGNQWIVPGSVGRVGAFRFTDGVTSQPQEFWYSQLQYHFQKEVWVGLFNGAVYPGSRTLAEVTKVVTKNSTAGWGRWELRRKDQSAPLLSFVPGQDEIPFILLQDDDTIHLSTADAAKGQPPPLRVTFGSSGNYGWRSVEPGLLRPVQQPNSSIPRPGASGRRVVLPGQGN